MIERWICPHCNEYVDIVGEDWEAEDDEEIECVCPKYHEGFTAVAKVTVWFCCTE